MKACFEGWRWDLGETDLVWGAELRDGGNRDVLEGVDGGEGRGGVWGVGLGTEIKVGKTWMGSGKL